MCRPKKHRIILVDPLEDRRAVTRFVLETSGYAVISAASLYEAAEMGSEEICAGHLNTLLLAYFPVSEDYLLDVAETLACPWMFIPPLSPKQVIDLIKNHPNPSGLIAPNTAMGEVWPSMAEVLERVKVASARRRGPMKGMMRPPRTVEPAPVEACA